MKEILVLAEHRRGIIRDITLEMLGLAKRLAAEENMKVVGLLLGYQNTGIKEELRASCDHLIVIDDPVLGHYNADPYLFALEKIIRDRKSFLTLVGHTATGMDLAPALAAHLSIPFMTDCVDAEFAKGRLKVQRQIYGGKIDAHLLFKPFEQYIMTVRSGCFAPLQEADGSGKEEIVQIPKWPTFRRRFLGYREAEVPDVDITAADILVSIGRGIGKPENIPIVQELADAIGATLSCSRPVADKGWLPKSRQVGTSGKTVQPKVYVALGISGAFQHQAGMKHADTIIAVNTDPGAPIFHVAHYGIVGDIFQVIPVLKEKFSGRIEE